MEVEINDNVGRCWYFELLGFVVRVESVAFTWSIMTMSCKKHKPSTNRTWILSSSWCRTYVLADLCYYIYVTMQQTNLMIMRERVVLQD